MTIIKIQLMLDRILLTKRVKSKQQNPRKFTDFYVFPFIFFKIDTQNIYLSLVNHFSDS